MRKIFEIPISDVIPSTTAVLGVQGIPRGKPPDERTIKLAEEAVALYSRKAIPRGILLEVSKEEFSFVLKRKEKNNADTPIELIYQSADYLVLYVVTIGKEISSEILSLFTSNDFALGLMLDSAASEGAEITAQALENIYRSHLNKEGKFKSDSAILRFSPGYCGWDISAQENLFQKLQPEEIGVTLNKSCLMDPLKSISGVIIVGKKKIFEFDDNFSFCEDCATHSCRERIKTIKFRN
jgi:hypothetical protein